MEYCYDLKEVAPSTAVKPFTKGVVIDYGICKFKQKVLADCITQYEKQQ